MESKKAYQIFNALSKANPEPKIELEFKNDFTLVLAVLLSAQTTDKNVNKATKHLFEIASTPEAILELGENKLVELIKNINLRNTKARNIIKLSKKLVEDNIKSIPNDYDYLTSLAGIGRKSAHVIRCALFNEPVLAVDTHVFRVSNRIGLAKAKNPLQTEKQLEKIIPKEFAVSASHLLVLHGRYVCKALKPKCTSCVIKDLCEFEFKTNEEIT